MKYCFVFVLLVLGSCSTGSETAKTEYDEIISAVLDHQGSIIGGSAAKDSKNLLKNIVYTSKICVEMNTQGSALNDIRAHTTIDSEVYPAIGNEEPVWAALDKLLTREISNSMTVEIKRSSLNSYFQPNQHFPICDGYTQISNIEFSDDYAFVSSDHLCDGICGYGFTYALRKKNKKWIVDQVLSEWVS